MQQGNKRVNFPKPDEGGRGNGPVTEGHCFTAFAMTMDDTPKICHGDQVWPCVALPKEVAKLLEGVSRKDLTRIEIWNDEGLQ